jgi:hypothetical protein
MNKEKEIINKVIKAFTYTTGLKIEVDQNQINDPEMDVKLNVVYKDKKFCLHGEIKLWITQDKLGYLIHKIETRDKILLTNYVTPRIAGELKNKEVQFLDAAGNAYINRPPIFVYIKGNKIEADESKLHNFRVFKKAGLKVLFAILNKPSLLNGPYRNITYASNVALGTVANALKDLRNLGYLIERGEHGKKILNKEELINKWVENYNEILKPTIIIGKFTTNRIGLWKEINPEEFQILWGGEIAANILTKYLKPQLTTVYTKTLTNKFIIKNKLIKAEKGNVEILDKFWNFNYKEEEINIVPPLLIYADLIRTADERNIEIAKLIYEREILKLIE